MMLRFIFFAFLLSSSTLPLIAQNYTLQKAEIRFDIENAGITVKGTFDSIPSITLMMPGNNPSKMSISGSISAASIHTGISIRDKHLRNRDYFDTEKYPLIYLASTSFSKKGNALEGNFTLQIKQTKKPVMIPITITKNGNTVEMNGAFTINRRDFNLGGNSLILSDSVDVYVKAIFLEN